MSYYSISMDHLLASAIDEGAGTVRKSRPRHVDGLCGSTSPWDCLIDPSRPWGPLRKARLLPAICLGLLICCVFIFAGGLGISKPTRAAILSSAFHLRIGAGENSVVMDSNWPEEVPTYLDDYPPSAGKDDEMFTYAAGLDQRLGKLMPRRSDGAMTWEFKGEPHSGIEGAEVAETVLRMGAVVVKMDLTDVSIGLEGAIALAEALKSNTGLQTLNLSSNDIGAEGALALAEALTLNTGLKSLNLSWTGISDAGVAALAKALKSNTALQTLDVSGVACEEAALRSLSDALARNRHLLVS